MSKHVKYHGYNKLYIITLFSTRNTTLYFTKQQLLWRKILH